MSRLWIDGKQGKAVVPFDSPLVQHGFGLFETLATVDGCAVDGAAHLDRLLAGIARLGASAPDRAQLEAAVQEAAQSAPPSGRLKIIWSADGHWYVEAAERDASLVEQPIDAVLLPWRRDGHGPLAGLKSCSYADHAIGRRYATERGADEGLWRDARGRLIEGCWSNLFVWRRGALYTPSERSGLLPGVVRGKVLAAAKRCGIPVHEGPLRLPRLLRAREAFVSSSLRGLCTLKTLDGRPIGAGKEGIRRRLATEIGHLHLDDPGATFAK